MAPSITSVPLSKQASFFFVWLSIADSPFLQAGSSTAGCCPNQATRFRELGHQIPPNRLGPFRLDTLGTRQQKRRPLLGINLPFPVPLGAPRLLQAPPST